MIQFVKLLTIQQNSFFHICVFQVDQPESPDQMLMTCEGWCLLHCRRKPTSEPSEVLDAPFSLLPALEDGYFSDLAIVASNNKKVKP